MTTQQFTTELVLIHCCECGMPFGLNRNYYDRRRDDGAWWHCPAGHSQHFSDSNVKKLERQLAQERAAHDQARAETQRQRELRRKEERSNIALRGVVTKKKKQLDRVKNGVCPCCNRHFANLERHMANQHPEFSNA